MDTNDNRSWVSWTSFFFLKKNKIKKKSKIGGIILTPPIYYSF
jgi:hypothetical protein